MSLEIVASCDRDLTSGYIIEQIKRELKEAPLATRAKIPSTVETLVSYIALGYSPYFPHITSHNQMLDRNISALSWQRQEMLSGSLRTSLL